MLFSEEFILVGPKAPPLAWSRFISTHRRVPSWRLNSVMQVGIAAVALDAVILMDVIHFNKTAWAGELEGRGRFFSACTVSQPTLARPEPGLDAAWADRVLV